MQIDYVTGMSDLFNVSVVTSQGASDFQNAQLYLIGRQRKKELFLPSYWMKRLESELQLFNSMRHFWEFLIDLSCYLIVIV